MFVGVMMQVVHTEEGMVMHGEHMKSLDSKIPKRWMVNAENVIFHTEDCMMATKGWIIISS